MNTAAEIVSLPPARWSQYTLEYLAGSAPGDDYHAPRTQRTLGSFLAVKLRGARYLDALETSVRRLVQAGLVEHVESIRGGRAYRWVSVEAREQGRAWVRS